MKQPRLKQSLFIAYILFATVCFFTACSKEHAKPTNTNYNSSGTVTGTDTSKADSIASFNAPTAVAVDALGNIYVADYGNNLIRKISAITGLVSTFAGSGNQGALNGTGTLASFNGPSGLAIDATGNLYVADNNNNQIRKITPAGLVSTLAGADSAGSVDGNGTAASFFGPEGLAVDVAGNVYVADAGNNLIRKVTPSGQVSTLAGNDNPGLTDSTFLTSSFNNPSGVTLDASGNIYVADMLNNAIREINISSGRVTTLAGGNDSTASVDGTGSGASFYFPNSLAANAAGDLYVTEYATNLIREVSPGGVVNTFAGSGAQGQADSTGVKASFNGPSGVAVDAAGNIYVADTYNNLIRKITPAGVVSTIAGSGNAGSNNGKAFSLNKKTVNAIRFIKRTNANILYKILVKKRATQ